MGKEYGNSAQCAWLFSHAHLLGDLGIQFDDGTQVHFLSLVFDCGLSLVFTAFKADTFFTAFGFFFTVFAGFAALLFREAALVLATDLRCCLARSVRSSSS